MKKVLPSLLPLVSSDSKKEFCDSIEKIKKDFKDIEVHFDIMDGLFVPSLALQPQHLEICQKAHLNNHLHFMVSDFKFWFDKFSNYLDNTMSVSFHLEAQSKEKSFEIIDLIKRRNLKIGIAIKPLTPIELLLPFLSKINFVTVMGVEPGLGGQKFLESVLDKLSELKVFLRKENKEIYIEIDGGMNMETIKKTKKFAENFIVGSSFFNSQDQISFLKMLESELRD